MIRINRGGVLILTIVAIVVIYLYSTPDGKDSTATTTAHVGALRSAPVVNLRKLLISSIQAAQRGGLEIIDVSNSRNLNQKSKGKTREGADDPVTDADGRSHCVMKSGLSKQFPNIEIISEEDTETKCKLNAGEYDLDPTVLHKEGSKVPDDYAFVNDITVWIDPLDATQEFTEKLYKYVTTMVCVANKGVPMIGVIHSPFSGKTYWAFVDRAVSADLEKIKNNNEIPRSYPIITVSRSHAGDVKNLTKSVFGDNSDILVAAGSGYKVLQVLFNNATAYLHSTRIKKWDICAGNAILNAMGGKMTNLDNENINYSSQESAINDKGLLSTLKNHEIYIKKILEYKVTQRT